MMRLPVAVQRDGNTAWMKAALAPNSIRKPNCAEWLACCRYVSPTDAGVDGEGGTDAF